MAKVQGCRKMGPYGGTAPRFGQSSAARGKTLRDFSAGCRPSHASTKLVAA
jgi:hypothetical protein